MCTYRDPELTAQMLRKLQKGPRKFWKVYAIYHGFLCTVYHGSLKINRGGVIRSNRANVKITRLRDEEEALGGVINFGIHCFISRDEAEGWVSEYSPEFVVSVCGSAGACAGAVCGSCSGIPSCLSASWDAGSRSLLRHQTRDPLSQRNPRFFN